MFWRNFNILSVGYSPEKKKERKIQLLTLSKLPVLFIQSEF